MMATSAGSPPRPGPGAGLCDSCEHQQLVRNTRGSTFSLCLRSRSDPAYPRYPRLPVLSCPGYEPARESSAADQPPASDQS
jgi:hypothetical protein